VRIAGVQLSNGDRIWADGGTLQLQLLGRVTVRYSEQEVAGWVFIAPEQLVGWVGQMEGEILATHPEASQDEECGYLPGADMPPLGSRVDTEAGSGIVSRVDAVERLVVIIADDGTEISTSLSENR
jgi:hypothetical protein